MRLSPLIFALAIACSLSAGCSSGMRSINPAKLKGPYEVRTRGATLDETQYDKRPIAPGSPEAAAIDAFLEANRSGWSGSLTSYAPGAMIVRGSNFKFMLSGDHCVFAKQDRLGVDLVKTVDPATAEQLRSALAAAQ